MDKQTAIMCKSFLTMLKTLKDKAGEEAILDEDGVKYVEQDFVFSHLETTWTLAMEKFHTPVSQRVIESISMGHNPNENDLKELYDGYDAKNI